MHQKQFCSWMAENVMQDLLPEGLRFGISTLQHSYSFPSRSAV